jgi:hypothetical protein
MLSIYYERAFRDDDCSYAYKLGLSPVLRPQFCSSLKTNENGTEVKVEEKEEVEREEVQVCSCFPPSFDLHASIHEKRGGFETLLHYNKVHIPFFIHLLLIFLSLIPLLQHGQC